MVEPEVVRDLTPEEVAAGLEAGSMLLVDVREPNETAAERIPGSVLLPLSRFDPDDIPDPAGSDRGVHVCGRNSLAACGRNRARGRISLWCSPGRRTEILERRWFSHRTVI
jgi:rhodanese-related sulfurtransferase